MGIERDREKKTEVEVVEQCEGRPPGEETGSAMIGSV